MDTTLKDWLAQSNAARQVRTELRVVLRHMTLSPKALAYVEDEGVLNCSTAPVCELYAGESLLARGELRKEEDTYRFIAKETV